MQDMFEKVESRSAEYLARIKAQCCRRAQLKPRYSVAYGESGSWCATTSSTNEFLTTVLFETVLEDMLVTTSEDSEQ